MFTVRERAVIVNSSLFKMIYCSRDVYTAES